MCLLLIEDGDKACLVATVLYPSLEVCAAVLGTGMARGAGLSYDRLEDVVQELHRSERPAGAPAV